MTHDHLVNCRHGPVGVDYWQDCADLTFYAPEGVIMNRLTTYDLQTILQGIDDHHKRS